MENQNDKLKTLTQAGAVGISILLIALLWKVLDNDNKMQINQANLQATQSERSSDVIQENTQTMQKLIDILENPRTTSVMTSLLSNKLTLK